MITKQHVSKAERTRRYIIETAAPIFNKKGYAGTSLSDLETATGLTKGAIYGNFRGKDEVALEAFDHNLSLLRSGFSPRHAKGENAIDRLLAVPRFYRIEFRKIADRGGCPILNAASEADDNNPSLQKKVCQSIKMWEKDIEHTIREGQAQGQIRKDISVSTYATLMIALIEGGIMLAKATKDPRPLMITLERVEEVIVRELSA